ncbi:MAG: hypothetical protein MUF33_01895 [Candidatus Nanopelagicales bacterium]|nr:hypothetical protein [Candidatus Nanopelagicales bacterium]MCU0297255.1 hypothetical protein [Candidatus Nanopelagicales bacterium]
MRKCPAGGQYGDCDVYKLAIQKGISGMQLCHTPAALFAVFDEPNLIARAGLVPAVALADRIGLRDLAD